jgi:hypothetical protein
MVDATINKITQIVVDFNLLAPNGNASNWASGQNYEEKVHFVRATGGFYVCTADHLSASIDEPGVGANWTSFWLKILQDGPAGETGATNNIVANSFVRGDTGGKDVKGSTQTLSNGGEIGGGFSNLVFDAGTKSSGTYTPNPVDGNMQRVVNNGAHTLAMPTEDTSIIVKYTNGSSAGAVTITGANKVLGSMNTTNGNAFVVQIISIAGVKVVNITGAQ